MRDVSDLVREVADDYDTSISEVKKIHDLQYEFMRKRIQELELHCDPEELEELRTNFNIPGFGKLFINKKQHTKINEIYKLKNKKNEEEE